MSLERRFLDFLATLPGAESLDGPNVLPAGFSGERADFALFNRGLIVEVKSLQRDPTARVQRIVDEYRSHPDFPLFYGQWPLPQVIARLPAPLQVKIRERVAQRVTAALAGAFEKAEKQIAASKNALHAQGAGGLLVVLNDEVAIQSPNMLVYRIQELLKECDPSGLPRFSQFDWVLTISEAHLLRASDGTWAHPFLMLEGPPSATSAKTDAFVQYIQYQWMFAENARSIASKADAATLENYRVVDGRFGFGDR